MCGICGVYHLDGRAPASPELVRRMADAIRHRGPDDEGFYFDGPAGLGHRRLSIIDLEGGHQPLSNEDGSIWIAFNGEIYNYRDLADDLRGRGHSFRTRSDTETIVHAYEEYGDACVEKLRGMFAFALWDGRRRRLLLVRDRVGIKPLYYSIHEGRLSFASEIKAILQDPTHPRRLNEDALERYLSLRYTPGPDTLFEGIHKLPAGGMLVAEDGQVRVSSYWDLAFARGPYEGDLAQWSEEFRDTLEEAVRIRLMSEVPLGAFLSGGLDSSVTVGLMSGMMQEPVRTFSVGYEGRPDVSEFAYARMVAERYETAHRELSITAEDYWSYVPRMVWHLDEPVADYACLPLYLMAQLTREHVTVILSGEGADELLAGYGLYRKMGAIESLRRIPGAGMAAAGVARLLPEGKLARYLSQVRKPLEQRYRGISEGFTQAELERVYPGGGVEGRDMETFSKSVFDRTQGLSPLHRMLYFDTRVYLVDDLLVKADKMTMAASLELRVPFLDHELMELAARLPPEAKLKGSETKRVLRAIGKPLLPDAVLNRPKKGFPVPIEAWLGKELQGEVRTALTGRESSLRGLMDVSEVGRILDRHATGAEDLSHRIWTLLVLEQWKKVFLDSAELPDLGSTPRPQHSPGAGPLTHEPGGAGLPG